MKEATFDNMRVWAALTGLLLAVWYFVELYLDIKPSDNLPMLIAGIGGFELMLFSQDLLRRKRKHG